MSLVNDMLRDLDQRRQEPSQAKFGAERLVPVPSDAGGERVNRSFIGFVLSIAITLGLIMGALYFWQSSRSVVLEPVPVQPAFSPPPAAPIGPSVAQRELEEIALRMRELEAQNRALIETQSSIAAQARATQTQLEDEIAQPVPAIGEPTIQPPIEAAAIVPSVAPSVAPAAESQAEAIAPLVPSAEVVTAPTPMTSVPEAPLSSEPIRSPRNLSFVERDQLQVQDALRLANSNQNGLAMQQLREFVDDNPSAHNSREAMIKLAMQRGDLGTAEQLLETGLALDAGRAGYRKLQARMMLSTGRAEEAMQVLSTRIPIIHDDVEYHDILATAYLSVQSYDKAAQSYEALVQQNRSEGRWWYGLASAWDSLGRTRDAGLAYQQALKLTNLSAALRERSQQRVAELGL
jgi:MSHA biogenesis protein MshN